MPPYTHSDSRTTYADGLLTAQLMVNKRCHDAHAQGRFAVSNALAELSTDLLLEREAWQSHQTSLTATVEGQG